MDLQVVGRDEPLARLDQFVQALAEGHGSLVIEGEAGIGKTTVWQAGVDTAAERGYRVLVSRPAESEAGLAYSGLADLLAGVDLASVDGLPGPQRQALEVAVLLAEPIGRAPEPRAIFTAFLGVLNALSRDAPVLVAVDDQQWLDRSSLRALNFVARRLGEHVGILATARLDPPSERTGQVEADSLRLEGLSPAGLHQLIKTQVGVSFPRPTILRVHRTTSGNPFFALELARVLITADLPDATAPWPVPDDLREIVDTRLESLPKSVRSVLLTAAATARPTISGLDAPSLRAAEDARIVTIGQHGRVRFAHPLFASAIYAGATAQECRRVHARLAEEETDLEERARHRALASNGVDEEVAEMLYDAAAKARRRGAPEVAAELAERSYALTPPDRPKQAWHRRATAAEHHFHAGDLDHARDLLLELVGTPQPAVAHSDALRLLGEISLRLGSVDDALPYLRKAVESAERDSGAVARAELDLGFVLFSSFGSWEEGGAAVRRALAAAEGLDDDALLSSALAVSAMTDLLLGRGLDDEKLTRALALEDPDQSIPLERRPSLLAGWAWLHADEFDRARALFESLLASLVERGEESELPELLASLARLECFAGNLVKAREFADRAYELARQAGSESLAATARAIRALVHAHAGEVVEARVAAGEAIAAATRSGWQIAAFWASTALGFLEVTLGNDEAALTILAHSIALVEQDGVVEPSRRPFLPDAIEALVRLGELERADRLTRLLEDRSRALERRSAVVAAARCRALVLAARGDVPGALEQLDRVLAGGPSPPMPLELARTLIVKGQLERRRKQKRTARRSLQEALAVCERLGAALWAERARRELDRLGRVPDPDQLTPTEARVAKLSASGLTNRQVAAAAFLSQKTVEANLTRIYRKLGIRSRAELGAWVAGRDSLPD